MPLFIGVLGGGGGGGRAGELGRVHVVVGGCPGVGLPLN